jgi:uncharacterized membrane protein
VDYTQVIGLIVQGIESIGVGVLIIGSLFAVAAYAAALTGRRGAEASHINAYRALRQDLGRAILLGLEFLVVADIIRSVAIDPTLLSVGALGLLVLIRTFLSWSLEVEIDGAWPWQRARSRASANTAEEPSER